MQSKFWRTGATYFLFAAIASVAVGPVILLQRGTFWQPATLLFAVGILTGVAGLYIIWRQTNRFTRLGIYRMVSSALGHEVNRPLFRACTLAELRGGQGGWTTLEALGDSAINDPHRRFCAPNSLPLADKPKDQHPALLVRNDEGTVHLFRFSPPLQAPSGPGAAHTITWLWDEGEVGKPRFEFELTA